MKRKHDHNYVINTQIYTWLHGDLLFSVVILSLDLISGQNKGGEIKMTDHRNESDIWLTVYFAIEGTVIGKREFKGLIQKLWGLICHCPYPALKQSMCFGKDYNKHTMIPCMQMIYTHLSSED